MFCFDCAAFSPKRSVFIQQMRNLKFFELPKVGKTAAINHEYLRRWATSLNEQQIYIWKESFNYPFYNTRSKDSFVHIIMKI